MVMGWCRMPNFCGDLDEGARFCPQSLDRPYYLTASDIHSMLGKLTWNSFPWWCLFSISCKVKHACVISGIVIQLFGRYQFSLTYAAWGFSSKGVVPFPMLITDSEIGILLASVSTPYILVRSWASGQSGKSLGYIMLYLISLCFLQLNDNYI